jgi:hypothetical protein
MNFKSRYTKFSDLLYVSYAAKFVLVLNPICEFVIFFNTVSFPVL